MKTNSVSSPIIETREVDGQFQLERRSVGERRKNQTKLRGKYDHGLQTNIDERRKNQSKLRAKYDRRQQTNRRKNSNTSIDIEI